MHKIAILCPGPSLEIKEAIHACHYKQLVMINDAYVPAVRSTPSSLFYSGTSLCVVDIRTIENMTDEHADILRTLGTSLWAPDYWFHEKHNEYYLNRHKITPAIRDFIEQRHCAFSAKSIKPPWYTSNQHAVWTLLFAICCSWFNFDPDLIDIYGADMHGSGHILGSGRYAKSAQWMNKYRWTRERRDLANLIRKAKHNGLTIRRIKH